MYLIINKYIDKLPVTSRKLSIQLPDSHSIFFTIILFYSTEMEKKNHHILPWTLFNMWNKCIFVGYPIALWIEVLYEYTNTVIKGSVWFHQADMKKTIVYITL